MELLSEERERVIIISVVMEWWERKIEAEGI
jgi:hypothetical protein